MHWDLDLTSPNGREANISSIQGNRNIKPFSNPAQLFINYTFLTSFHSVRLGRFLNLSKIGCKINQNTPTHILI